MEAVLLSLIAQLNASVFTLIAILVLVIWLTWKGGGWSKSYKNFEDKSDKFDNKIDDIKDSLSDIKATTKLLYQAHVSTIKSQSPVSLTPRGEDISKKIKAEEKVNNHWEEIKEKLEKKNPKNPYDIQMVAMDIGRTCFDGLFTEEERNEIKTYAFQIGLDLLEIYPIIGIIIRDKVLAERNIKLEEVDVYDPAKNK